MDRETIAADIRSEFESRGGWVPVHMSTVESLVNAWIESGREVSEEIAESDMLCQIRRDKLRSFRENAKRWRWGESRGRSLYERLGLLAKRKGGRAMQRERNDARELDAAIENGSQLRARPGNRDAPATHGDTVTTHDDTRNADSSLFSACGDTAATHDDTAATQSDDPLYIDESRYRKKKKKENARELTSAQALKLPIDSSEIVALLPLTTGAEYAFTRAMSSEFATLYPGVDVPQAARAMRGWLISNPTKRKTPAGIVRFINNWLSRAQDTGQYRRHAETRNSSAGHNGRRYATETADDYRDAVAAEAERLGRDLGLAG